MSWRCSLGFGAGAIRDFFGSLDRHKVSKGLFVTTSSFSASAQETAEFLSKRIVLIDGTDAGSKTRSLSRRSTRNSSNSAGPALPCRIIHWCLHENSN